MFCLWLDCYLTRPILTSASFINYKISFSLRYCEEDFHRLFRMRTDSFKLLLEELGTHPEYIPHWTQGQQPISVEKKTLIGLSYMATSMSLRKIGDQFNSADSSVLKAVDQFCQVLANIKEKYIKWPTEDECVVIASQFESLAKFPGN